MIRIIHGCRGFDVCNYTYVWNICHAQNIQFCRHFS